MLEYICSRTVKGTAEKECVLVHAYVVGVFNLSSQTVFSQSVSLVHPVSLAAQGMCKSPPGGLSFSAAAEVLIG